MGITIYATGRIGRVEDIPSLSDEVKRIAKENAWGYETFMKRGLRQPKAKALRARMVDFAKQRWFIGGPDKP